MMVFTTTVPWILSRPIKAGGLEQAEAGAVEVQPIAKQMNSGDSILYKSLCKGLRVGKAAKNR